MKRSLFLLLLLLLTGHGAAYGARTAPEPVLVETTGEATGSDLESPREVCNRARAEAQRSAIEQATGAFLRSYTVVSNSQLADDLIFTQVRGRIDRLELLKEERSANNHGCLVRIRALVSPVYPDGRDAIRIKAALTRSQLREGDDLTIQYQLNRDGYVYLFVIAADNAVTQLLPNSSMRENLVRSGEQQQFPPQGSGLRLKAALQKGSKKSGADERVKIIVTSRPEPLLERGFQEGFAVYGADATGLISDLLKRLGQLEPADWGEATLEYRIEP